MSSVPTMNKPDRIFGAGLTTARGSRRANPVSRRCGASRDGIRDAVFKSLRQICGRLRAVPLDKEEPKTSSPRRWVNRTPINCPSDYKSGSYEGCAFVASGVCCQRCIQRDVKYPESEEVSAMKRTLLLLTSMTLATLLAMVVALIAPKEQARAAFPGIDGNTVFARHGARYSYPLVSKALKYWKRGATAILPDAPRITLETEAETSLHLVLACWTYTRSARRESA